MDKYIICGLGNPGLKYRKNRHNAGFIVLDHIMEELNLKYEKRKYFSKTTNTVLWGKKIVFLKPQTYMNESGKAVYDCANLEGINSENILIIYDDIDLPFGTVRFRTKGSAGTHNGMKSILNQLKTKNVMRIRVGVGSPSEGDNLIEYVLGNFSKLEVKLLSCEISDFIYNKIEDIIGNDRCEGFNTEVIKNE